MFQIFTNIILNNITHEYEKIYVINKYISELSDHIKLIKSKKISPFKENSSNYCEYAFIDENGEYIKIDNISEILTILNDKNLTVDTSLTKTILQNKKLTSNTGKSLVFIVKLNN